MNSESHRLTRPLTALSPPSATSDATPAARKHVHYSGTLDKHRTAINTLSDDVLLEIFDFCQIDSNNHLAFTCPGSDWLRLVHICQRWRRIVLVSPRRLDLTLFCTYGTPVRKNIGFLPPLPIILDYLTPSSLRSSAPNYEDDIIAALDHPSRVRSIKLVVTNSLLEMVALVMQEPFPALTTLWLSSKDRNAPVLPDVFLSDPHPQLSQIFFEGVSFPALHLLPSASNLVDLQLRSIPQSGYISPEVMVSTLAALHRLEILYIWFKAPAPYHHDLRSLHSLTRNVLLSLVVFNFRGSSEYLEHLLARIDTPRLRGINITYFNQLDFQVPQLSHFVRRTESLELGQSRHSQGRIRISSPHIELDFKEEGHNGSCLTLRISCKWLDWQVLHLAQILDQSPAMVSNVDHLSIDEDDLKLEPGWKDSVDDTDWIELLRSFSATKTVRGSKQPAGHIALALDGVGEEMITEVMPALTSLSLEDQPVRSVEKFLAARQNSGHPVTFVDPALPQPIPFVAPAIYSSTQSQIIDHSPTDLLVDGFIARTFTPADASNYLMHLFRAQNFLQYYGIVQHQGAWYITHNSNLVQGTSPGVPHQSSPLLDYTGTRAIRGTVVSQSRWSPVDELDVRRHVESAALQLPIFFVNRNGGLGFQLTDILRGNDGLLRNANGFAPLGGKTTTHIRINWPGYSYWRRQIPARDETYARNPITMGRFMKYIGSSVDKFFTACMSNDRIATDPRWQIGATGGITREEVIVIGAINVSAGSWMPILQLNRYVF